MIYLRLPRPERIYTSSEILARIGIFLICSIALYIIGDSAIRCLALFLMVMAFRAMYGLYIRLQKIEVKHD